MSDGGLLSKHMLTFEPVRMVHMKKQCPLKEEEEEELHTLELSNLDLLYDDYNSVALFYHVKAASIHNPANKLLTALQELLLHYPAAAGRLHINDSNGRYEVKYKPSSSSSLSCSPHDDYGLPFIVAHADTTLSRLGDVSAPHPSLDLLYPSLPNRDRPAPVMVIQVTMFTCGSFSLALMSSHTLTDGYSAAIFLRNLCSITKGEWLAISMDIMNRREVVKPRVPLSPKASHPHICTWKRGEAHVRSELSLKDATGFSFSKASLEALRQRASNSNPKLCSRFQALVAFFWITRAKWLAKCGSSPKQELPLRFPINMREREFSIFTQSYIGNAILQCTVLATLQELCESSLAYVTQKIMSSMGDMHMQDYVQSEIDYIELQLQNGLVPCINGLVPFVGMASLANLPFYDTDCGWGRPIYCGRPCRQVAQWIIILDDPQSKGWNVIAVMSSAEEHELFQEEISKCICTP